jgi:hypothetical protein
VQRGFHAATNAVENADVSAQAEDDNPRTLDAKRRLAAGAMRPQNGPMSHF